MSTYVESSSTGANTGSLRQRRAPKTHKLQKPMTASQRNKLATQGITTTLDVTDEKVAVIAVLETVHERLGWDEDLRERIREKYQEIAALTGSARKKEDLGPVPIPIRTGTPEQYAPYAKFDPYKLNYQYGPDQLRAVLVRGTQRDLREATDIVQARNPGTKPASRSRNTAMIEYILDHVAGPNH